MWHLCGFIGTSFNTHLSSICQGSQHCAGCWVLGRQKHGVVLTLTSLHFIPCNWVGHAFFSIPTDLFQEASWNKTGARINAFVFPSLILLGFQKKRNQNKTNSKYYRGPKPYINLRHDVVCLQHGKNKSRSRAHFSP